LDIGNVTDMGCMFFVSKFDHSLDSWNVSKTVNTEGMFTKII